MLQFFPKVKEPLTGVSLVVNQKRLLFYPQGRSYRKLGINTFV